MEIIPLHIGVTDNFFAEYSDDYVEDEIVGVVALKDLGL